MIAIHKSTTIPTSLQNVVDPISEESVDKDIYGAQDVRRQLRADQHGKCAYCECARNGGYWPVEHFRPKGAYQKEQHGSLLHPGYYWLAYRWDNLLYSCDDCNSTYKRCLFPLFDESKRNMEAKEISQEEPLLINPATEDPEQLIGFREEMPLPLSSDLDSYAYKKAATTISVLHLDDRNDLLERRLRVWKGYNRIKKAIELLKQNVDDRSSLAVNILEEQLESLRRDESEFAGMIRNQVD